MSNATLNKPRLTTSAMIASIAAEGQRTQSAPFGNALVELENRLPVEAWVRGRGIAAGQRLG